MKTVHERLSAIYPVVMICMIAASALAVIGSNRAPASIEIASAFDAQEGAYIHETGEGTVEGRAFVRLWSGDEVPCADKPVLLVPRTALSEERIEHLYGSTREPGLRRHLEETRKLEAPDSRYREYMRRAPCDEAGEFRFKGIADGAYFVVGGVSWRETIGWVSISMMQPVDVEGGELVKMVLTPGSDS